MLERFNGKDTSLVVCVPSLQSERMNAQREPSSALAIAPLSYAESVNVHLFDTNTPNSCPQQSKRVSFASKLSAKGISVSAKHIVLTAIASP